MIWSTWRHVAALGGVELTTLPEHKCITLPAHTIADSGLKIIEEYPELRTNIHQDVGDLDVKGSYPYGQACLNISRETTVKEIITIEGVDEHTFRMQGIGLSGGPTNSIEYCQLMMNFPSMEELRQQYLNTHNENK